MEVISCPVCEQKLAVQAYVIVGTELVCANCETNMRITKRRPLRVEQMPIEQTYNADSRPESYG